MRVGDVKPDLELLLSSKKGPVDVTDADAVAIKGYRDGVLVITDRAPVDLSFDADTGHSTVIMNWESGDTTVAGLWTWTVKLTWPGGKSETVEIDDVWEVQA